MEAKYSAILAGAFRQKRQQHPFRLDSFQIKAQHIWVINI